MCGRFTQTAGYPALAEAFPDVEIPRDISPRYNIAPTQPVLVIPNELNRVMRPFRWGLVPHWAKDISIGNRMINARGETLSEKPSFRELYKRRRCLVVADGFYEWRREPDGHKTPYYVRLSGGRPFGFAGLWDTWDGGDELLHTCTIITTSSNELVARIHDRMPVIIPPDGYGMWLDPEDAGPGSLDGLLSPFPADEMETYAVSTLVNKPEHDTPDCVTPAV